MTFQPGVVVNTQSFGNHAQGVEVPHLDSRAPGLTDILYPVGKRWVNTANGNTYTLGYLTSSNGATTANWVVEGAGAGTVVSLTTDDLTVVTPTAGTILLAGTANQISTAGSNAPGKTTLSLPSAITAPGSLTTTTTLASGTTLTAGSSLAVTTSATVGTTLGVTGTTTLAALTAVGTANINASGAGVTTIGTGGTGATNIGNATGNTAVTGSLTASTSLTATAGDITATLGNVIINGAAKQLRVHGGAVTDFIGETTLTAGTVTIANTNIASTDRIFVQRRAANASTTLGELSYTISAATSFTITSLILGTPGSTQTGDVSTVEYFIVRQV